MSSDVMTEPAPTVDRRAQRLRASGAAEKDRAAAEAQRMRTQHRRWELRQQRVEQKAEARRRDRVERQRERAEASARRAARARVAARSLGSGLPEMAGAVACIAPTLIATRGQYQFALTEMRLGPMAVLVPMMLEGAAWMLAWRRHQAIRGGEPTGRLTLGVWALALTAAGLNVWHGSAEGSLQVGVAYGVASLVGFGLVELLAGHQRRAQAVAGGAYRRGWLLALARWLRYPRLSWAAWSRRIELGPGADGAEAWRQAWRDRFDVEPGADARARRQGRRAVKQDRRTPAVASPVDPARPALEAARPGPHTSRPGPGIKRRPGSGPARTRNGPARTRNGSQAGGSARPDSGSGPGGLDDSELLGRVRDLARAGDLPSRNEVARKYGIGKTRATRLLAQLDHNQPARPAREAGPAALRSAELEEVS